MFGIGRAEKGGISTFVNGARIPFAVWEEGGADDRGDGVSMVEMTLASADVSGDITVDWELSVGRGALAFPF